MRRLAQAITAVLALGFMVLAQPWELRSCQEGSCVFGSDDSLGWVIFGTLIQVGVFAVILGVVLVGVLGIRDASRASESAVLAALGQSIGEQQVNAVRARDIADAHRLGVTDVGPSKGVVAQRRAHDIEHVASDNAGAHRTHLSRMDIALESGRPEGLLHRRADVVCRLIVGGKRKD